MIGKGGAERLHVLRTATPAPLHCPAVRFARLGAFFSLSGGDLRERENGPRVRLPSVTYSTPKEFDLCLHCAQDSQV